MEDCIFCKIVKGELPSHKIYEDEDNLAFLDINPTSDGHTLVIPKKHFVNFEDIPAEELKKTILIVKKIGLALKEGLGVASYNVCVNNDLAAGQLIPHIHFHLIPRYKNDGLEPWPQASYPAGRAEEVSEKILKKLKIN